jgi:Mn-dependent DtxR family transcriptional regulator
VSVKIQEAAENYLEEVLMVTKKQGHVRQTDICAAMNYSRPTVSVALRELAAAGYLDIDDGGYITLTDEGRRIADRIYERHCVLANILMAHRHRRGHGLQGRMQDRARYQRRELQQPERTLRQTY